MKFTKRILSLLLAVVMVVTMLNSSLVSLASITVINDPVSAAIVVPELIYKTPGADTFQYYIAGVLDGETPSVTAETQGSIEIYTSRPAESISISAGCIFRFITKNVPVKISAQRSAGCESTKQKNF